MKKLIQGILAGLLICFSLSSVFALNLSKNISVSYRDIKLSVNDEIITPKDASGNIVEPFIHDGTTYLPVRAVGEALGRDVSWNGETSTVIIDGKPAKKMFLAEKDPIFRSTTRISSMKKGDVTRISVNPKGADVDLYGVYVFEEKITYDLKGVAERITGKILLPTAVGHGQARCKISFLDETNKVLFEAEVTAPNISNTPDFDLNLKGKEKLTILFDGTSSYKYNQNLKRNNSCIFNVDITEFLSSDY